MFGSPEIYNANNLKNEDKRLVSVVDEVSEEVLNESSVDAFIEEKQVTASTLQSIYKEVLDDFIDFLRVRADFYKTDMVINLIDGYSEAELAAIRKANSIG